jgi:hypothetical protein
MVRVLFGFVVAWSLLAIGRQNSYCIAGHVCLHLVGNLHKEAKKERKKKEKKRKKRGKGACVAGWFSGW